MKAGVKLRVVCDTNVLLSMLGFPGGRLDALWEIIQGARIELFLSKFILDELSKNLRLKARLQSADVDSVIQLLSDRAEILAPREHLKVIRRKDSDNRILECALDARADVLVTGNFKDLVPLKSFRGIAILTPRAFLDRFFPAI